MNFFSAPRTMLGSSATPASVSGPAASASTAATLTQNRLSGLKSTARIGITSAQATLGKVGGAISGAAARLAATPAAMQQAVGQAEQMGRQFGASVVGPAYGSFLEKLRSVSSDNNLDGAEIVILFAKVAEVTEAVLTHGNGEVSRIYGAIEGIKGRLSAMELVALEVPRVAGRLTDVADSLNRQGFIESESMVENLKNGKLYINGAAIDLRAFLLGLVAQRSAQYVEAGKASSYYEELFSQKEEASFTTMITSVDATTKYDPEKHTHIMAPTTANGAAAVQPILTVFPGLVSGATYPANFSPVAPAISTTGAVIVRKFSIRATHTMTGLLQVAATAGVQSLDSALAQLAPLGSNLFASLFGIPTGADFKVKA